MAAARFLLCDHLMGALKKSILLMFLASLLGCATSVRAPAREATRGVLDVLEHPEPSEKLAVKFNKVADHAMDLALKVTPPDSLDKIILDFTESLIKSLQLHAPEEIVLVRTLVREALSAGIGAVKAELPGPTVLRASAADMSGGLVQGMLAHEDPIVSLLARGSGEAGRALAREAASELFTQLETRLGRDGKGPLSEAVAGSVGRTAAVAIKETTTQVAGDLEKCTDPEKCPAGVVRKMSRSVALGVSDGVGRNLWEIGAALAFGIALALGGSWLIRWLVRRGHFASFTKGPRSPPRDTGRSTRRGGHLPPRSRLLAHRLTHPHH